MKLQGNITEPMSRQGFYPLQMKRNYILTHVLLSPAVKILMRDCLAYPNKDLKYLVKNTMLNSHKAMFNRAHSMKTRN